MVPGFSPSILGRVQYTSSCNALSVLVPITICKGLAIVPLKPLSASLASIIWYTKGNLYNCVSAYLLLGKYNGTCILMAAVLVLHLKLSLASKSILGMAGSK